MGSTQSTWGIQMSLPMFVEINVNLIELNKSNCHLS